ncbi:MAG: ATP synthase subunit I [Deltaproteobacteria bacterium]|nr:ATP synthase subunit I [Deltaproteobacteria bacterium]MBW2015773.1 ATP synthase subunit I [Deltaproteobacteria bacterium]MBW2128657.1 ATP synthase subunit I [Deltaproteobacteria bacterium]
MNRTIQAGVLGKLNWAILLVFSSLSFFFMSPSLTLGVILGGLAIIANFNLMQRTLTRAFDLQGRLKSGKGPIIAKYYLRLLALWVLIYVLVSYRVVDPIGLAVGLSTVVLSIVVFGILMVIKSKTGEAT